MPSVLMPWLPIAVSFTVLPDPIDVGIVGSGSAVGGVIAGLLGYFRGGGWEDVAGAATKGALLLGTLALIGWLCALAAVSFR
jgi:hypothetical protein